MSDENIDLRQYWLVFNRNKWRILAFAAAASALATVIVFALPPVYKSSSTILIESQSTNVVAIEDVYGLDVQNQQYLKTQFEILNSRPLVESVIDRLDLKNNPEFASESSSGPELSKWLSWLPLSLPGGSVLDSRESTGDVVQSYYDRLAIEPKSDTYLVDISFDSVDPELAATVANAHAEAYIQSLINADLSVTETATNWMAEQLSEMQEQSLASERRLQEFREKEKLVDVEGLKSLPAMEINELTMRLVEARERLSQSRIAYTQVYKGSSEPLADLSGIPAILEDQGVQELQQAEAQAQTKVAELAKRYGPSHNKMIAAQSDLDKARENLRSQSLSVAMGIKNKFEAAQAEESELKRALDRAKQQYQEIGRKESQLLSLQREAQTNRELYDLFYNRLSETTAVGDLASPPARVIAPAIIPDESYKPNRALIVGLVFLASIFVGALVAFIRDALNTTIRTAQDVEDKLESPLLGMLPLLKGKNRRHSSVGHVYFDPSEPDFAEAMRTIRTGISLDSLDNPNRVILVTSSLQGEGKSTVALNLAYAFAKVEKVLLIDADMRRPSIAKDLDLPAGTDGLAELITGKAKFSQCVVHSKKENLDVMSSGAVPEDPLGLLSGHQLKQLLQALRTRYDRIIIDCPPAIPVSDSAVLCKVADSVVFVVKSGVTTVLQAQAALKKLRRTKVSIAGIVLNQHKKQAGYDDYGYESYAIDLQRQPREEVRLKVVK